jgi:hypothetical protein
MVEGASEIPAAEAVRRIVAEALRTVEEALPRRLLPRQTTEEVLRTPGARIARAISEGLPLTLWIIKAILVTRAMLPAIKPDTRLDTRPANLVASLMGMYVIHLAGARAVQAPPRQAALPTQAVLPTTAWAGAHRSEDICME